MVTFTARFGSEARRWDYQLRSANRCVEMAGRVNLPDRDPELYGLSSDGAIDRNCQFAKAEWNRCRAAQEEMSRCRLSQFKAGSADCQSHFYSGRMGSVCDAAIMEDKREEIGERVSQDAAEQGRLIIGQLRYGYDGIVFEAERQSAFKVLRLVRMHEHERDIYLRLYSRLIRDVAGFAVPQLTHHDDHLWGVDMGIVSPPFMLDFAGAYLAQRPDYPDDVLEEWQDEKLEQFGADRWDAVQEMMAHFAGMGIYLADVKPGNIMFAGL